MNENSQEIMIKCFCESRKAQAFYTRCLDENSSEEEKEFLMHLIKESALTSRKILDFCKKT